MTWRLLTLRLIILSDRATLDAFPNRACREGREHLSQHTVEVRRRLRSAFLELEPKHLCVLVQLLSREILGHQIRWVPGAQDLCEFNEPAELLLLKPHDVLFQRPDDTLCRHPVAAGCRAPLRRRHTI